MFTPLESPFIHGGDDIIKFLIPHPVRKPFSNGTYIKGGNKALSFLTGLIGSVACLNFRPLDELQFSPPLLI
jgi:hypothetical protein